MRHTALSIGVDPIAVLFQGGERQKMRNTVYSYSYSHSINSRNTAKSAKQQFNELLECVCGLMPKPTWPIGRLSIMWPPMLATRWEIGVEHTGKSGFG